MRGIPPARRQLSRASLTAALVACALGVAACGDAGEDDRAPLRLEEPAGLPSDFNLQLFNCADWNKATPEVRAYVLRRMHEIANDQITGEGVRGRGSVLTDAQATDLYDARCRSPRARGFVLYKLYAYARGFGGRGPSQP